MTADLATPSACRAFAELMDVQFWLIGRDVEHPAGNQLEVEGFVRECPSRRWPSRYRRGELVLWRCGMLLATAETRLLLVRSRMPVVVGEEDGERLVDVHDPDEVLGHWRRGDSCPVHGLVEACGWFAGYEARLSARVGIAHRVPPTARRPALAPDRPCSLEERWRELVVELDGINAAGGARRPGGRRPSAR